jgi:hypothetical protein
LEVVWRGDGLRNQGREEDDVRRGKRKRKKDVTSLGPDGVIGLVAGDAETAW